MRLDLLDNLGRGYSLKSINKKMDNLFVEYLNLRRNRLSKTYLYACEKNYNKYLKEVIGNFHPNDITTSRVQKVINNILDSGKAPQTAKQIKEIVIALYKFLPELGIHNIDNIGKLIKIPKFDNSRKIELTDDEMNKLFNAIFNYPDIKIRTIFIWLLEVLTIKWEDIDFQNNIYTIKRENSKISKSLVFALTDTLIKVLTDYGIKNNGLVFESNINENQTIGKTGMDYHWKNIRIETGLKNLNMHDLRHVVGGALVLWILLEVVGKTLGHTTANIT